MVTSSKEGGQVPLVMVHLNTLAPVPSPVTPLVGELGVVRIPVPLTSVHVPLPTVGVLPAKVVLSAQMVWFVPASAGVGSSSLVIVTSSKEGGHTPLVIVHLNTLAPSPSPVTPLVGEPGVVMVPVPLISVHVPLPTVGALPPSVAVVAHTVWLVPASATVGTASLVIVTSSKEGGHTPLEIVQRNTFGPTPNPVNPLEGEEGVVIIPVPLISVHVPLPTVGVLPAKVVLSAQMVWFVPASAGVGSSSLVIVTSSKEGGHTPLVIVHLNTLAPSPSPVTPLVGEPGVVMVPVPLISVHVPLPTVGVLPPSVAVVAHTVWLVPASATVGLASTVMVTSSKESAQTPLEMVHLNTFAPSPNPVTPLVGEPGVVMVPVPFTSVHVPLPTVGALPPSVAVVAQMVWLVPASAGVGGLSTVTVTSSVSSGHVVPEEIRT